MRRFVEHFGEVLDLNAAAAFGQATFELQQAAGVARDYQGGRAGKNVVELALLQLARLFGIGHVVDTRAAAAQAGFVDLGELNARNAAEEVTRLAADALRVEQMAGVLVDKLRDERVSHRGRRTVC